MEAVGSGGGGGGAWFSPSEVSISSPEKPNEKAMVPRKALGQNSADVLAVGSWFFVKVSVNRLAAQCVGELVGPKIRHAI